MPNKNINYLLFALLALLWSGSFITIKLSVASFPPIFSAMMRVAIGLITLTLLFHRQPALLKVPRDVYWRVIIIAIFSQGLPFALLFAGEQSVAPAIAGILNSTTPLWAFILNIIIFQEFEQITWKKILGLLIGIVGIVTIFSPDLTASQLSSNLLGMVLILIMAASYAIGAVLNQHFLKGKGVPFRANLWHQHIINLIFLMILSLSTEHWPSTQHFFTSTSALLALLYLGAFSTALAWIIYYHLIHQWDAVRASSVMYVVPVLAIVWDKIFLHTEPSIAELIGAAGILIGVVLIQLSKARLITHKEDV